MDNSISGLKVRDRSVQAQRLLRLHDAAATSATAATGAPSGTVNGDPTLAIQLQGKPNPASADHLAQALKNLQERAASYSPELKYSVDDATGKSIVKLTDTSTNTLIWQFPSDEAIQVAKAIDRFEKGWGFDLKA